MKIVRERPAAWLVRTRVGSTLVVAVATRHGRRITAPIGRAASSPKVHGETRQAAASASRAVRRAHRVGLAQALSDRRVTRELRRTTRHASRAASLTLRPEPSHRRRNTALLAAGALLSGAVYAGYRTTTSSRGEDAQDTDQEVPGE
jgi:hypothetical protein